MDRYFVEIRVSTTNDGMIEIVQNFDSEDRPDVIRFPPGQVDTLVQWLQEAKAELID